MIITANLRDFPNSVLGAFGIEAIHPDAFIVGLVGSDQRTAVAALRRLRQSFKDPSMTASELLAAMSRQYLSASADAFGEFLDFL